MKYRFNTKLFEPEPDQDEIAFSWLCYDIAKYFFEIARNVLVIGTLKFFADKTGHWALTTMFLLSLIAFLYLVQSFFFSWRFRIFVHFLKGASGKLLDGILSFIFAAITILGSWFSVMVIAAQIAAVAR